MVLPRASFRTKEQEAGEQALNLQRRASALWLQQLEQQRNRGALNIDQACDFKQPDYIDQTDDIDGKSGSYIEDWEERVAVTYSRFAIGSGLIWLTA